LYPSFEPSSETLGSYGHLALKTWK